ncbi:MAG TPA: thiamine pyrophosphate-binding protein [Caldilineaceae bacterium]|nr:thiamine pyrophosphate-binding protein [Caldilineaceae bacterium]
MTIQTGGEAIVNSWIKHGVDTIFGLPGAQNDYLYNALYDVGDQLRVIHTRHEQGAGYMALGYTMSTGRPGVYAVVPGVGMLNASAALATGYSVNAQLFCFTGQIPSKMIGRGLGQLHEIPDQLGILARLTKWTGHIPAPEQAPGQVAEAFLQLQSSRPRPVAVECPLDVLSAKAEIENYPILEPEHPALNEDQIEEAARLLGAAKNPLIFVGLGALGAAEAVKELAEALQAPVVSTRSGHGLLSSRDPLAIRTPVAHELWPQTDVALFIGTRQSRTLTGWGTDDKLKIIRIDIDPAEHSRAVPESVGIVARSEDALPKLVEAVGKYNSVRPSRAAELDDLRAEMAERIGYMVPQLSYLNAIRDILPDDGYFIHDVTQLGYVSDFAFPVYQPRTFIGPGYQGTLGWGFATALGVKVAHPDKPVVAVCGDGGFMFTMQELATAVQHKINLVTLVFNDGAYGNVLRMQKENYGGKVIATALHNPDFARMAETFGALGLRATNPDEVRSAIEQGLAADVPTIIEVPIGEVPSPWPVVFMKKNR